MQLLNMDRRRRAKSIHTSSVGVVVVPGCVVDAHVDRPRRQIAEQERTETAVEPPDALVPEDDAGGPDHAAVLDLFRPVVDRQCPDIEARERSGGVGVSKAALVLEPRLDDVERAGHDAGCDSGDGAAEAVYRRCVDCPGFDLRGRGGGGGS